MKKIIGVILLIGIMLISLVGLISSLVASDLGTFSANTTIELYQSCENCTFVNLSSVKIPNGTVFLFNSFMTKNAQDYNFTFSQTNLVGSYLYNTCGDKDGILDCEDISFSITKTGSVLKTSESFLYFIIILGVFMVFLFSMFGAIKLPFSNNRDDDGNILSINKLKYFKLGLILISYVLFVWLINAFLGLTENFIILDIYGGFFTIIFHIFNALAYPFFVIIFILFMVLMWKDLKLREMIQRGFNEK